MGVFKMKNNLYTLGLVGAMVLYGCNKNETPKKEIPSETKRQLEVGEYTGMVNGKPAKYEVTASGSCYLTLRIAPANNVFIVDSGCDNTADTVDEKYERKHLEAAGRTEKFDSLLRDGQELVKPKNKVKHDYQKELDDLLNPASAQTETPQTPEKVKHNLPEGTYKGLINGHRTLVAGDKSEFVLQTKFTVQAEYTVLGDNCFLTLHFPKKVVGIYDADCNDRADEVTTPNPTFAGNSGLMNIFHRYSGIDLDRARRAHQFDSLLHQGRRLVESENRVWRDYEKEVDDLLRP